MASGLLNGLNAVFLLAMAGLVVTESASSEPAPIVAPAVARGLAPLEIAAANAPTDVKTLRPLAEAYLREGMPGHAIAALERAPQTVDASPALADLASASYLASGRTRDAFAMSEKTLTACDRGGCDATFLAHATRRAELLGALLDMGVEDASADPDAVAVAYRRTSRQVRIAMN